MTHGIRSCSGWLHHLMIGCFFQFVVQSSWFSPRFVCACRQKVRCQFHQHLFNGQKRGGVFPFLFAGLKNNKTALWRFSAHHPESANKMRQLAALVRFPDTTTKANIIKEFNQPHIKLTAACFQQTIQHLHLQFIYKPLENNSLKGDQVGLNCVWMWNCGYMIHGFVWAGTTRSCTLIDRSLIISHWHSWRVLLEEDRFCQCGTRSVIENENHHHTRILPNTRSLSPRHSQMCC